MAEARPAVIKRLFLEVVELPVADREPFLQERCGADPEVRGRVEELLRHDEVASAEFLGGRPGETEDGFRLTRNGESATTKLPARFGHYRLVRVLGEGGMGTVYEAEQDHPKRLVALKVIRAGQVTPALLRRFEREAQALGRLQHPGIAQIYEAGTVETPDAAGQVDQQPFFAMESIRGEPINSYVQDHHVGTRARLELVAKVCDAVAHAHEHGVVHRDLKPANILVTDAGLPKILDFGVARLTDADIQLTTLQTNIGQLIGTVPYMSPEQLSGDPTGIDTRSDIYALGVILYELLAGRLPHELDKVSIPEAVRIIRDEEPSRLGALDSRLRGDIETIVLKVLEKDKARRYASAADVAADIRRHLADQPIVARPVSTFYQLRKFAKRHKALCGAAGAVFVVLLGATIVSTSMYLRAESAHLQAHQSEARATERLCDARLAQARASRSSIYAGRRFGALDAIAEAARIRPSLELRNEAIAAFNLVDVRPIRDVGPAVHAITGTFDAAGNTAVILTGEGTVQVRRVSDGAELVTLRTPGGWSDFAQPSPDGHLLAVRRPGEQNLIVGVFEIPQERSLFEVSDVPRNAPMAFAPDDRMFAVGTADHRLHLYDVPTGHELRRIAVADRVNRIAFSPDGRRLAVGSYLSGPLEVLDVETGEPELRLADEQQVWGLGWRPDGRILAAGCHDRRVRLYDAVSGAQVAAWSGHTNVVIAVAFNHRGDMLLSRSWDGTSRLWDVSSGSELLRIAQWWAVDGFSADDDSLLAWQQNGDDLQPFVAGITSSDQLHTLQHSARERSFSTSAAFLAGGRLLLTGVFWEVGSDSGVRIWDVGRRELIGTLPMKPCRSILVAPDESCFFTSGDEGLLRWPVARHEDDLTIGPPRELDPETRGMAALSADARRLVCLVGWQVDRFSIFDTAGAAPRRILSCAPSASMPALSPSGRWLALAKFGAPDVEVWDLERDAPDVTLPVRWTSYVAFDWDEHWLAISDPTTTTIWEIGTWQPRHSISVSGGSITGPRFSPDGRYMAVLRGLTRISLFRASDFIPLATLELPDYRGIIALAFSPQSQQLAVTTENAGLAEVWDLWRVRANLAGLGLDFDSPPYPPRSDEVMPAPLTVSVLP